MTTQEAIAVFTLGEKELVIRWRAQAYYEKTGHPHPEDEANKLAVLFVGNPHPRGLTVTQACAAGIL